jgi:hypothetical protein
MIGKNQRRRNNESRTKTINKLHNSKDAAEG